ncbi:hypothetical protein FAUST_6113 [Fusarium austroamericanum]|uniref:Uncharacterized protein n=1 Tax=Fusarium austroamericanum TaxID=282268 RepID=A0AAN6BZS8_FUSAU|nr:hypothetical protein FAUST_6113 [Fusarium austroamericanum]
MMNVLDKVALAHVVMVAVGSYIPSLYLFFSSLCTVRSQKDPVRTAFTYAKYALFTFSAHAFFDIGNYSTYLIFSATYYYRDPEDEDYDWGRYASMMEVLGILTPVFRLVGKLSDVITDILIAIILLRLSTAILTLYSGSAGGKKLRHFSYGLASALVALALTFFGLQMRSIFELMYGDIDVGADCYEKGLKVELTTRVLIFVTSLAVFVKAVMVKKQAKADKNLTWASTMLVVASVVWLLHTSFAMSSMAAWENFGSYWSAPRVGYELYFYILDVIFKIWPQFVTLVLAYVMGRAKANGIWSRQQNSSKQDEEGK